MPYFNVFFIVFFTINFPTSPISKSPFFGQNDLGCACVFPFYLFFFFIVLMLDILHMSISSISITTLENDSIQLATAGGNKGSWDPGAPPRTNNIIWLSPNSDYRSLLLCSWLLCIFSTTFSYFNCWPILLFLPGLHLLSSSSALTFILRTGSPLLPHEEDVILFSTFSISVPSYLWPSYL